MVRWIGSDLDFVKKQVLKEYFGRPGIDFIKNNKRIKPEIMFKKIYDHQFILSSSFFILIFAALRLPFYLYINIPYIFDDAPSYAAVAKTIVEGTPFFLSRTPGYPFFLSFMHNISADILLVEYAQSFITICSSLFFIYTINRIYPKLTIPATFAITIFTSSVIFIHSESSILTECLYVNIITLFISFYILSLKTDKRIYWFFVSLSFIVLVYVRPTGLFLVPLLVLQFMFAWRLKYPRIVLFYLVFPAVFFYSMISAYNFFTLGHFSISTQGFSDMVCNTFSFIEKDDSFPDYINQAIDKAVLAQTNQKEHNYIENSWDIKNITALYLKYQSFDDNFWQRLSQVNPYRSKKFLEDCKNVTFTTIKNHPNNYMKFIAVQYLHYFDSFHHARTSSYPFFESYEKCFRARIIKYFLSKSNQTGTFKIFNTPRIEENVAKSMIDRLQENNLLIMVNSFSRIHQKLFRNHIWVLLYFVIFIYSFFIFLFTRCRNIDAFIVFSICLINLLNVMLISIANIAMIRYNFTLHLTYYLAPALLPSIIFFKRINPVSLK